MTREATAANAWSLLLIMTILETQHVLRMQEGFEPLEEDEEEGFGEEGLEDNEDETDGFFD